MYHCPKCGSANIRIDCSIPVTVNPNELESTQSFKLSQVVSWEDDDAAYCLKCKWHGEVSRLQEA